MNGTVAIAFRKEGLAPPSSPVDVHGSDYVEITRIPTSEIHSRTTADTASEMIAFTASPYWRAAGRRQLRMHDIIEIRGVCHVLARPAWHAGGTALEGAGAAMLHETEAVL